MRGSIRRRGSTYTWYISVPDPMTGERRQRSKGGFRTKRECQEALNEALTRLREGTFVRSSPRELGAFLVDERRSDAFVAVASVRNALLVGMAVTAVATVVRGAGRPWGTGDRSG